MGRAIAALYVAAGGCYFGQPDVDPWDVDRDARAYAGPHPVVAHPPCQRWGRYWYGGPMLHALGRRKQLGDDGGCFTAAVAAVRRWGGVLEHPQASHAWSAHGITKPPWGGGWIRGDDAGWTCCVEQGHYGHRARKATWLYVVGCDLPPLAWGRSTVEGPRIDQGFHSKEERRMWQRRGALSGPIGTSTKRMSSRERAATPDPFRDLLISIARTADPWIRL